MKPLIVILFIIFSNSCSQDQSVSSIETQIEESNEIIQDENPSTDIQLLGPNEVMLQIKILEDTAQNKEICGVSKDFVYNVEVLEIVKIGSSIHNKISTSEKFDIAFLFEPENLVTEMTLEIKAKESLCPDASQTYFTILEHRILE